MGMFSDLMGKIFHHAAKAEAPVDAWKPSSGGQMGGGAATGGVTGATAGPATATMTEIDVAASLDKLAASRKEKLDWKHSIVDLMKLVGMESSLAERKELAADLHYTGDTNDTATMNIWLHKQVMDKLAENGGKVPASLLQH